MHMFWWMFWFFGIAVFFSLLTPVPRSKLRETPLELLQRRYAAHEITTPEYEERRQRLVGDASPRKSGPV